MEELRGLEAIYERVELALAQAKRIQRDSRYSVQQLAQLRDALEELPEVQLFLDDQQTSTANLAQGENNGRTHSKEKRSGLEES